ncbi:Uncharacterised protein [Mycobacteroides abscessus subsp. abscessus]|nr:Uncharacterised protein [Mycobacteroides abscessus subsp. abscessus]
MSWFDIHHRMSCPMRSGWGLFVGPGSGLGVSDSGSGAAGASVRGCHTRPSIRRASSAPSIGARAHTKIVSSPAIVPTTSGKLARSMALAR